MRSFVLLLLLIVTMMQTFGHKKEKREALRRSKRRWVLSTIELIEEDKGPFPKEATTLFNDNSNTYELKYFISGQGVNEPPIGVFSINDSTGVVYVHKTIDREKNPQFHVMFDVMDRASGRIVDRTLAFDVAILDINDNPPAFHTSVINASVKETTVEGDLPISISAMDADDRNTNNSKFSMRLVSQDPPSPKFGIKRVHDTDLRQLTFSGCFDYDKVKNYTVLVAAKDFGRPSLSSTATVKINIVDGNSHAPEFAESEYTAEVMEMTTQDILRMKVNDKDLPNTPASRAKFMILKGNEEGNYKIVTDPTTNEGVLSVIKAKDFERTTVTWLQIAVENEEPLFVCGSHGQPAPPPHTVNVTVTVLDVNDSPEFRRTLNDVFYTEELEPGALLFTPEVTDEDSDVSKIRYELIDDPEHYVKIDEKTGALTTIKKMDRESSHVINSTYTITMRAIDDGTPPATATATVQVHLIDINDNLPFLVNKSMVLCGNKDIKVNVKADDKDAHPFRGPFVFSLGGNDPAMKSQWKLDPEVGESTFLVSLKSLAYGSYTVPLKIQDQQGKGAEENLNLMICDCGKEDMCRRLISQSSMLGGKGFFTLISGLLLLLLLLCLCLSCKCGDRMMHSPLAMQEDGTQTLIKYNEEAGGSKCKAEPEVLTIPNTDAAAVDFQNNQPMPTGWDKFMPGVRNTEGDSTLRSQGRSSVRLSQDASMQVQYYSGTNTRRHAGDSQKRTMYFSHSQSLISSRNVSEHIERSLCKVNQQLLDDVDGSPHRYAYEGENDSTCSLDDLSLSNYGDNLSSLQDLDPKFKTLGEICHSAIETKNLQL